MSEWNAHATFDIPVAKRQTSTGHARELTLDLYVPADGHGPNGRDGSPLLVYVHGGGWREGTNDRPPGFRTVLGRGFALAALQYRFSAEGTVTDMLDDLRCGVGVARQRAAAHGCDADVWYLWGISAGGHLASLFAVTAAVPDDRPVAVASWCGPMDLRAYAGLNGVRDELRGTVTEIVDALTHRDPDLAREFSPLSHVSPDAPPHFFVHGTADGLVPLEQSHLMHEALKSRGVRSEIMAVPDGMHAMPPGHSAEMERTLDFLAGVGKWPRRHR